MKPLASILPDWLVRPFEWAMGHSFGVRNIYIVVFVIFAIILAGSLIRSAKLRRKKKERQRRAAYPYEETTDDDQYPSE